MKALTWSSVGVTSATAPAVRAFAAAVRSAGTRLSAVAAWPANFDEARSWLLAKACWPLAFAARARHSALADAATRAHAFASAASHLLIAAADAASRPAP